LIFISVKGGNERQTEERKSISNKEKENSFFEMHSLFFILFSHYST